MPDDPKPTGVPHWSVRPDLWDGYDPGPPSGELKINFELPEYMLEALAKRKARLE